MAIRKSLDTPLVKKLPPGGTTIERTIDRTIVKGPPVVEALKQKKPESFVDAGKDTPVDLHVAADGKIVAGAVKAKALAIGEKAAATSTTGTAEERLRAILGKDVQPEPSKAPKPAVLQKAIENQLGEAALHMSPLEVASALGAPSWASAVKELGACADGGSARPNYLLALHLTKWMDSFAYPGATRGDVAKSFLAAHPEVPARFPHLDGPFIEALQKTYKFMPQWQTSPAQVKADDGGWDSLATADVFAEKLNAAVTQLAEVPLTMKLTSGLADKLVSRPPPNGQPFAGTNVVMVQHMLGQANPLVDAMTRAGMDVERAEYVGIPYQKNPAVKTTLEQGHGLKVTVPEVGNIDDMWKVITAAVDRAWERHLQNGEPILILDDGGYASKYIAEKYKGHGDVFKVVEQTTRGLTEISKIPDVEHSIVDVAGSYGKRFESAQVGDAVKMAVRRVLDAVTTTPARKDVLIVGAGKVGEGVADSFGADGARITIFDPFITPARQRELEKKGFTVVTDKAKALDKKFLVVGCSGHRSIDMADFAKMSSPVFLASASSKRVEIDTIGLGDLAKDKEGHLRKILAAKVGEQETWHYFLEDGRIITAMADGLPVNFQAVNSIAPELIDHTMGLMLLGAAQAMTSTKKGMNALEPNMQFWLQAQMEGLRDGKLDGDIALAAGDLTFYGSRADWMRIATSPATPPAILHALFAQLVEAPAAPGGNNGGPMDPIALAILSSKHDLAPETLDLVLQMQLLPHVARLLQNEGVTDAQEDKLLEWLEKSFWAAAGSDQGIDVRTHNAVAVEGDEKQGYGYIYADVVDAGNGRLALAHRITTVYDTIMHQTGDLLFGHARCPEPLREVFLERAYSIAQDGLASTVLRVKSAAWTTAQLDKLFDECASAALSRNSSSGKRESYEYAYDMLEAFRDHPSASPAVIKRADELMTQLAKDAQQKKSFTLQGSKAWVASPLGIPLPNYG